MGIFDQAPVGAVAFDSSAIADPFDALCVDTISILEKTTYTPGADDSYGIPDQTFQTLLASWPARVSTNKGGQEYKQGKESAKNTYVVFGRFPTLSGGQTLNTHHWIRFTDEQGTTHTLNVTAVNDPSFIGHHFEAKCEEYLP